MPLLLPGLRWASMPYTVSGRWRGRWWRGRGRRPRPGWRWCPCCFVIPTTTRSQSASPFTSSTTPTRCAELSYWLQLLILCGCADKMWLNRMLSSWPPFPLVFPQRLLPRCAEIILFVDISWIPSFFSVHFLNDSYQVCRNCLIGFSY